MVDTTKDSDLLLKIYENLIRTDEKLKALIESNRLDHNKIDEAIKGAIQTQKELDQRLQTLEKDGARILQDKIGVLDPKVKDLIERVGRLELEGIKMGVFWKILVVIGPIAASVLVNYLMKILTGGK